MANPSGHPAVVETLAASESLAQPETQAVTAPAVAYSPIRALSLNCEGSRHMAERILPFIAAHLPDVLALQEVNQCDLPKLQALGYIWHRFMPMMISGGEVQGIALLARMQPDGHTSSATYYLHKKEIIGPPQYKPHPDGYNETIPASVQYGIVSASFKGVRVATTHIMVTHQGHSTLVQREMVAKAIAFARGQVQLFGNVVLCGDFNAPRGRESWEMLTQVFYDNIPPNAKTTLDRGLHLSGHKPTFNDFVVDGVFSGGNVYVRKVQLVFGISDHAAILFEAEPL